MCLLQGELTLVTDDGESPMAAGMCIGFRAGEPVGHHLINRSEKAATFIVVGARVSAVDEHYPDDDLQWIELEDGYRASRKDGTPHE